MTSLRLLVIVTLATLAAVPSTWATDSGPSESTCEIALPSSKSIAVLRRLSGSTFRCSVAIHTPPSAAPNSAPLVIIGASTKVRVTAKTFGQTPAYKVAVTARAELAGSEDHLTPVTDAGPSLGILAPGCVTVVLTSESIAIPNAPTQPEIDSATFTLYVHGLIAYTDTFGKKRWSRFRQVHDGHKFVACRSGNDADDSVDLDQKPAPA